MSDSVAIGIDLGGTHLKAATVDRNGRVLARRSSAGGAIHSPDVVITEVAGFVDAMLGEVGVGRSQCVGLGVGAPGPLSVREGRIHRCANLPGWVNVPLRDWLKQRVRMRVTLDNDGNAAAFGEYWAGAGRGCPNLVLLTLGTGVGGGVILDGRLVHGHFENAAELGHMIVEAYGLLCACGQRGCLERYASAAAVARRTTEAIGEGKSSRLSAQVLAGNTIDAQQVVHAAQVGDSLCLSVWNETCRYLAVACINIQHAFNPQRVLLGGGMSAAGPFLLDRVREHLAQGRWSLHDDVPEVALAALGNDAGVVGAAGLAFAEFASP